MAKSSAKYFEVRWRTRGADEAWSAPQRIDPSKEVVVEGLDRTKSYDFEVRAVSNCGAMSLWVPSDYTVPTVPPLPAVNLPVGSGVSDGVQLDWGDGTSTRADLQYEISRVPATGDYADAPPPSGHASWKRVAIVSGTTWVDAVTDTAHYWYRLRTVDYRGNVGEWTVISSPPAASISTPELANTVAVELAAVQADIDAVQDQADQLRDDVDGTIAQVQALQGQVGDILQADVWASTAAYPLGDLVQSGGKLYRARQAVPAGTPVTDTAYWELIGNYASLGEAVGATAANVAVNNNKITQAQDDIRAQSQSIAQNAAAIGTKADASALATTNATVSSQGDAITASVADIALLGAHNAGKTAFNLSSGTVRIDGGSTLAQTITGLQASDTALGARIDTEQMARVNGDSANASAITALRAGLRDSGNLVQKSFFDDGQLGGWSGSNRRVRSTSDGAMPGLVLEISNATSPYVPLDEAFPCVPGEVFELSMILSAYGVSTPTARPTQNIQWRDESGVVIGYADKTHVGGVDSAIPGQGGRLKRYLSAAPAGAVQGRPGISNNGMKTGDYILASAISVRRRSVSAAVHAEAITAMNTTVAQQGNAISANASQISNLSTTVGGHTSSISTLTSTTNGLSAQAVMVMDVNGRLSGMKANATATTSSVNFLFDNFTISSPSSSKYMGLAGGVMQFVNSASTGVLRMGVPFGADTDKLIFGYVGANSGTTASQTLAKQKVGFTASGRYKFGSTWGGLISGWSSGGAISYTSTTTSATIGVASGVFRIGDQPISYSAGSVSVSGSSGLTRTYYLYYDDPGMAGGSLTLRASTNPVSQYDSDGRVVIGQLSVTFKSGGGGSSNPVCPVRNAYVWRRRGTDVRWVRARRVRPGDWLRVIDPATGELRWGLVTYSRPVLTECVTVATDAGVALTCSRTAPLGTPDGDVLSIDAEGRTVSGYADGFVTPKVTAVADAGRQWVQHITCENTFFLAGDEPGEGLAHHNLKPLPDLQP